MLRRKLAYLVIPVVLAPSAAIAATVSAPRTLLVLEQSYDGRDLQARLVALDLATGHARGLAVLRRTAYGTGAWSPDGRSLAVADASGHITLVDAGTGARRILPLLATKPRTVREPTLAAWAPDGRSLAIVEGGAALVVRATSGKLLRIVARTRGGRYSVANPSWSPDGRWIGFERFDAGGVDGRGCCTDTYRLVPATGGAERTVLTIHDGGIHDSPGPVFWSPDSTRIAFTTEGRDPRDSLLGIVDVGTRVVRRPLAFAFRGPLAWSPDGKRLAVSSRKGLVLLDAATGTTTPLSAPKPGQSAVFSPDGQLLALLWTHNGRDNSVTEGVEVIAAPGARPRPALVVTAPPGFNVTATGWQP